MPKVFLRIVALILVPCLVADPLTAASFSPQAINTSLTPLTVFSACALIPEPAMSEGMVMYSLGLAGSPDGFRNRVLTFTRQIFQRPRIVREEKGSILLRMLISLVGVAVVIDAAFSLSAGQTAFVPVLLMLGGGSLVGWGLVEPKGWEDFEFLRKTLRFAWGITLAFIGLGMSWAALNQLENNHIIKTLYWAAHLIFLGGYYTITAIHARAKHTRAYHERTQLDTTSNTNPPLVQMGPLAIGFLFGGIGLFIAGLVTAWLYRDWIRSAFGKWNQAREQQSQSTKVFGIDRYERQYIRLALEEFSKHAPAAHLAALKTVYLVPFLQFLGAAGFVAHGKSDTMFLGAPFSDLREAKELLAHELGHVVWMELPEVRVIWNKHVAVHPKPLIWLQYAIAAVALSGVLLLLGSSAMSFLTAVLLAGSLTVLLHYVSVSRTVTDWLGIDQRDFVSARAIYNAEENFAEVYREFLLHPERLADRAENNEKIRSQYTAMVKIFSPSQQFTRRDPNSPELSIFNWPTVLSGRIIDSVSKHLPTRGRFFKRSPAAAFRLFLHAA